MDWQLCIFLFKILDKNFPWLCELYNTAFANYWFSIVSLKTVKRLNSPKTTVNIQIIVLQEFFSFEKSIRVQFGQMPYWFLGSFKYSYFWLLIWQHYKHSLGSTEGLENITFLKVKVNAILWMHSYSLNKAIFLIR